VATSLSALLEVQRIEGRIGLLDQEIGKRPQMVGSKSSEVESLKVKRVEIDGMLKTGQILHDKLELDFRSFEEKIAESTQRLNNAQTNKEYKALQHQIDGYKGEASEIEDNLLLVLGRIEEITAEGLQVDEKIVECKEEADRAAETADSETESMERERGELVEILEAARKRVDPEHLEIYDTLSARYSDQSVVSAEDQICGGCHLSVNPQVISALGRSEELVTCPNCSRILHG